MSDKNYKSFKDYIEKRTVADVMSDYTEQKDEWEELPLAKTDKKSDADSKTKNTDAWWIQFYNFPLLRIAGQAAIKSGKQFHHTIIS